ncbi:MAG: hypothetical protein AMXMBFR13_36770 [Phycisphaerae bacterium]
MLTIENEQHEVHLKWHGRPLLRYRVTDCGSKPHFDAVALPAEGPRGGENIALGSPHDHVWHFGLFFAQKYVESLNFWESERLAAEGQPYGECRSIAAVSSRVGDDGSAVLAHEIDWRTSRGDIWIREHRELAVHPPTSEGYVLDWRMTWTAVGADRTLSSGGEHGGYSGLSYRPVRSMDRGRILTSEGAQTAEAALGQTARWADYSGRLDGKVDPVEPDWAGLSIFDHPSNKRFPSRWFCMVEPFGFLAANQTWDHPWLLRQDQPVTTRFGVFVHAGPADGQAIEAAYARFAAWTPGET